MAFLARRWGVVAVAIGAIFTALCMPAVRSGAVWGCAPAPHPGEWVGIQGEQAVIVWDAKAGVEHFIRQARFDTTAKDFGFLVPTPAEPELGEVQDAIFGRLSALTAPKINYVTRREKRPKVASAAAPITPTAAPDAPRVEVLQEKTVAGLDAVVLKAEDPALLGKWLTEHGYASRPELEAWLKAYTDQKWIITAFKLGSEQRPRGEYQSVAIRMSFPTDRPFYPYREPEDMRDPAKVQGKPRQLRVFLLAADRMVGTLGDPGKPWHAKMVWAKSVESIPDLLKQYKIPTLTEGSPWRLTEFEDDASPRPGTDEIYFSKDPNQDPIERPPVTQEIIQYYDEGAGQGNQQPSVDPWELTQIYAAPVLAVVFLLMFLGWRQFVRAVERRDNSGATPP